MRSRSTISVILLLQFVPLIAASDCIASTNFAAGVLVGTIQNSSLVEASGIAASRMNPNVLWTHNDSGDTNRVFAMTPGGTNLGVYTISGANFSDWEDIAVGPGPAAGAQYLYIGDIGDNAQSRSSIVVYRAQEPMVSDTSPDPKPISGVDSLRFNYPDGPHNAESLFVDPLSRDIYIVTKPAGTHYVFRAAYPQSTSGATTMQLVASYSDSNTPTAADISPNGNEIIVRSYATSGRLYTRPSGGSIADAFNAGFVSIPIHSEQQGEAIGFDPNGWGYYTTSEGSNQPIYYYNRLPSPAGTMFWDNNGAEAGTYITTGAGLGGTATWDTSSRRWYNGSADVAWVDGNDAIFWGTAGTVTLSAAKSANNLSFKSSGYTINGSTLTLTGGSVTVEAGMSATIASLVAGAAGFVKNGAGILFLTNTSNQTSGYTSGTIINGGTLNVASGTISRSGESVTINNGSALQFTGSFTLAAARAVTLGPGGGAVDTNSNSDMIAGPITGTALTKIGAGTLTLTNSNTYTGGTSVSAGTLLVMNATGSGTGPGQVTVDSGAILGGTGTIQGTVTNNGAVGPGSNVGTLHLGATYTQSPSGRLECELSSLASHDELAVSGMANLSGTLAVSLLNGFVPTEGNVFEIITASGFDSSTFTTLSLPTLPGNLAWDLNYGATAVILSVVLPGDFNGDGAVNADDYVTWRKGVGTTYAQSDYDVWREHYGETSASAVSAAFGAVPEPAAWILSGAGAATWFIGLRKKPRKPRRLKRV